MLTKKELATLISLVTCEYEESFDLFTKSNDWNFLKDDLQTFQSILEKLRELYDKI